MGARDAARAHKKHGYLLGPQRVVRLECGIELPQELLFLLELLQRCLRCCTALRPLTASFLVGCMALLGGVCFRLPLQRLCGECLSGPARFVANGSLEYSGEVSVPTPARAPHSPGLSTLPIASQSTAAACPTALLAARCIRCAWWKPSRPGAVRPSRPSQEAPATAVPSFRQVARHHLCCHHGHRQRTDRRTRWASHRRGFEPIYARSPRLRSPTLAVLPLQRHSCRLAHNPNNNTVNAKLTVQAVATGACVRVRRRLPVSLGMAALVTPTPDMATHKAHPQTVLQMASFAGYSRHFSSAGRTHAPHTHTTSSVLYTAHHRRDAGCVCLPQWMPADGALSQLTAHQALRVERVLAERSDQRPGARPQPI